MLAAVILLALAPASVQARTRTGAVTIRGIAMQVTTQGFSLQTHTRGTLKVQLRAQTLISLKGRAGSAQLHDGDHVGVRGFVSGLTMVAMTVRIYPVKPKPFTVRGVVHAVGEGTITIEVGSHRITGRVTTSTVANIGIGPVVLRQIHIGDRVEARMVGSGVPQVLTLHLYKAAVVARHVTLSGVVASTNATGFTVSTGTARTHVSIDGSTSLTLGVTHVGPSALRPGLHITVHACCAGRPLLATSVHISRPRAPHSVLIHGTVRQVSSGKLWLQSGSHVVAISIPKSVRVSLGSVGTSISSVRTNDQVSVRAVPGGSGLVALTVHVFVRSRHVQSVVGTVVSTRRNSVVITTRTARRWTVLAGQGAKVSRSGRATSLARLQVGDRVHARGQTNGSQLVAGSIIASAAPARKISVHGKLVTDTGGAMTIASTTGARVTVHLPPGVRPDWHGTPAPPSAIFAGVRVSVRGTVVGGKVLASRVTITVIARHIAGRVHRNAGAWLDIVHGSSSHVTVDVPAGLQATDSGHRLTVRSIHAGAYVAIDGYEVASAHVRAASIGVQHPLLSFSAAVVAPGDAPTVQTTAGQRYTVHPVKGIAVTVSRYAYPVAMRDVPIGARLRVTGSLQSDGSIRATILSASLRSTLVRGTVGSIGPPLAVALPTGNVTVRLVHGATVVQGSHPSDMGAFVIGDDVSLHGYLLSGHVLLTRSINLHRKLTAMTGVITTLTATGFLVDLGGQQITVVMQTTTLVSGSETSVLAGYSAHVTGYLRGDGVIEATRVKMGKRQP